MRRAVLAAAVLLLPAAGAPPPGASSCSGCHGGPAAPPSLDGLAAADMVAAMAAFRTDQRPVTVMDRIAKGFTPAETAAIAVWYEDRK
jgi:sulfide dehydrogenase cytochrome subunit